MDSENKHIYREIYYILNKAGVKDYDDYRSIYFPPSHFPNFRRELGTTISHLNPVKIKPGALDIGYAPLEMIKLGSDNPQDDHRQKQLYPFNVLSPLISLASTTQIVTDEVRSGYNPHKGDKWYEIPDYIVELIITFRPYIENEICTIIPKRISHQTLDDTSGFKPVEILKEISNVHIPLCFSSKEVGKIVCEFENTQKNILPNNKAILPTLMGHPPEYVIKLRNEYSEELLKFQRVFRKMIPMRGMRYTPQSIIDGFEELDYRVNKLHEKLKEVKQKHARKNVELWVKLVIANVLFFTPPEIAKLVGIVLGTGTIYEGIRALFIDPTKEIEKDELYFAYLLTEQH